MIYFIIFINCLFFIFDLFGFFSMFKYHLLLSSNPKIYSFFTYAFFHLNFEHLFMNMASLFAFYKLLYFVKESILLFVYIFSLICSAIVYYVVNVHFFHSDFIMLGASAGVCAIIAYASFILHEIGFLFAILLLSFVSIILNDNVAWSAHIYGAFFGILCAFLQKKIKFT